MGPSCPEVWTGPAQQAHQIIQQRFWADSQSLEDPPRQNPHAFY